VDYFNHLREMINVPLDEFGDLSINNRARSYQLFLADNPDHLDDILVEPAKGRGTFRTFLLDNLLGFCNITTSDELVFIQASFFAMCEHSLFETISDDYERTKDEITSGA